MNNDLDNLSVIILLSTFNGAKYLVEQIESIKEQTFSNWQLLIRDDGSSDTTVNIIKQFVASDSRIHFIEDKLGNLRAAQSFSVLMSHAIKFKPNYIFFCDQDDYWLVNKLAMQVMQLIQLEQQYGSHLPLLVHSDLQVVDSNKNVLHHSFLEFENIKRNTNFPLKTLLINNFITGCTIGMNHALLTLATPLPAHVFMHDWWCGLCAAAAGKIAFLNQATLLYRQHDKNTIGSRGLYGKISEIFTGKKTPLKRVRNLQLCFDQANSLLERLNRINLTKLNHELNFENPVNSKESTNLCYDFLCQFSDLKQMHFWRRYLIAIKLRLVPSGYVRGILFWILLCFV